MCPQLVQMRSADRVGQSPSSEGEADDIYSGRVFRILTLIETRQHLHVVMLAQATSRRSCAFATQPKNLSSSPALLVGAGHNCASFDGARGGLRCEVTYHPLHLSGRCRCGNGGGVPWPASRCSRCYAVRGQPWRSSALPPAPVRPAPIPHLYRGALSGLSDTGTAPGLTVTNTNAGTISGKGGGFGFGIDASTATVTNNGTISGTSTGGGFGFGIEASTATVTNNGTISSTSTGGGNGIDAITATVINNGTISAAAVNAVGIEAATATVTNSGTISGTGDGFSRGIDAPTATVTNNGTISGTSTGGSGIGVGINSAGTVTVTNNSIISGTGTAVSVGIAAATAAVTNNGTISGTGTGVGSTGVGIDVAIVTVTNNGTISGTGASAGVGIETFAGSNVTNNGTITGTTSAIEFVGSGGNTLTLGPTSIINGGVLALGANNLLQLGGSGIGSFDVSLIGPAAQYQGFDTFNKIGAATWTLTGVNAAALPWTVQQGILLVNGSLANSPFTVNGGTLGGTGTIGNTQVNSGGTLAPGSGAPGTSLTIHGNLAFQSGALYLVQVNSTTASLANVTGTASLAGTVQANIASATNKSYDILHSAGLGGTRFDALVITNPNFGGSLSFSATDVFLTPTANLGAGSNLNQNQQNVAGAINNFFNSGGTLPPAFGTLFALTGNNLSSALSQVSGEVATGSQQTTFNAMGLFMGLLTDPFMQRNGTSNPMPGASGYADEASAYAANKKTDAFAMFTKAPPAATFEARWSVWAAGFGGSQSTDGNAAVGSNNTTSNIAGTAVGADYLFSPNTMAGFALAGGGTSFSVANAGTGRSDLFQAGAYVRHTNGPAYVSAALAYGWQDITTNRTVTVAGSDQLRAEFNANAFSGRLEGGYRFVAPWVGGVGITPYAAAQFVTFDLPAYAESALSGASTFALAYNAKNVTDTRSELGIRTDKSWAMTDGILTLLGRLAWAHDYDPNRSIASTFQSLPGASFVVNGAAQASDSALVTASVEKRWLNGWSAAATFEGEFSDVTRSYAGKGVVRYTW